MAFMLGVTSAYVNTYFLEPSEEATAFRSEFGQLLTGENTMSCKEIIREIRALRGWKDTNRIGDDYLDGQVSTDFYTLGDVITDANVAQRTAYLRRITEAEERIAFGLGTANGNAQADTQKPDGQSFADYLGLVLGGLYDGSQPPKPLLSTLIDTQTVDAGSDGVYDTAALLLQIKTLLDSLNTVVTENEARDILIQIRELLR